MGTGLISMFYLWSHTGGRRGLRERPHLQGTGWKQNVTVLQLGHTSSEPAGDTGVYWQGPLHQLSAGHRSSLLGGGLGFVK